MNVPTEMLVDANRYMKIVGGFILLKHYLIHLVKSFVVMDKQLLEWF